MNCGQIMKSDIQFVTPNTPVKEAACAMRDRDIGFLPVCDEKRHVLGTLTDRDIAIRLVAEGKAATEPVNNVMTREAICCLPGDDIEVAQQRMASAHKSRIMCTDSDGCLVGIISLSDIAQAVEPTQAAETMRSVTQREAA